MDRIMQHSFKVKVKVKVLWIVRDCAGDGSTVVRGCATVGPGRCGECDAERG